MPAPAIVLLTDFGTADGYVAEIKGVLLSMAPRVPVIDASHDIPAQDVNLARITLARYWRRFPEGTVHLCIVDPGVGTERAAIAAASDAQFFVGPDNGVLSPALFALDARIVEIPVPVNASPTFHGRDVFAPAAARLARGEPLESIGEPFAEPRRLRTPQPRRMTDGTLLGEIISIDRFGNAVTNLVSRPHAMVEIAGLSLRLCNTYSDVEPGEPLAVTGSTGLVEVAVRDGSAAERYGITRGTAAVLRVPLHG